MEEIVKKLMDINVLLSSMSSFIKIRNRIESLIPVKEDKTTIMFKELVDKLHEILHTFAEM